MLDRVITVSLDFEGKHASQKPKNPFHNEKPKDRLPGAKEKKLTPYRSHHYQK